MAKAPIDFYFDFSSPYGYIASTRIDEIAARHGRTVAWRPILLGVVFKTTGMGPLPSVPLKGAYSLRDFERSARLYGVAFKMPVAFPFNAITPSRMFYWLEGRDRGLARRFGLAAFQAAFPGQQDITKPDVCADIAANLDPQKIEVLAAKLGNLRPIEIQPARPGTLPAGRQPGQARSRQRNTPPLPSAFRSNQHRTRLAPANNHFSIPHQRLYNIVPLHRLGLLLLHLPKVRR